MEPNVNPTILHDDDIPVEEMPDFSTETDTELESCDQSPDAVE